MSDYVHFSHFTLHYAEMQGEIVMSVSPAKIENDCFGIQVNGFEELKRRIKQRGYVRKNYCI